MKFFVFENTAFLSFWKKKETLRQRKKNFRPAEVASRDLLRAVRVRAHRVLASAYF